jgi:hypothetical protein
MGLYGQTDDARWERKAMLLLGIILGVAMTFAGSILFVCLLAWIAYARRPRVGPDRPGTHGQVDGCEQDRYYAVNYKKC